MHVSLMCVTPVEQLRDQFSGHKASCTRHERLQQQPHDVHMCTYMYVYVYAYVCVDVGVA